MAMETGSQLALPSPAGSARRGPGDGVYRRTILIDLGDADDL